MNLFAAELGVGLSRVPVTPDRFENISTVSIPLGIGTDPEQNAKTNSGTVAMSAFEGALSCGSCVLQLNDCYIGKLEDYR